MAVRSKHHQEAIMSRLTSRTAFTALALGVAALAGIPLASGEAAAKSFHSGWGKHHHHGHGHGGFRFGFGYVGYAPAYLGVVADIEPDDETCVLRRVVTYGGRVVLRKRCY